MDDLDKELSRHFWWHSIELREGVVTPGRKTLDLMKAEAGAFFDSVDLGGKSVLDIGTWNGGFSFEAKRRGAGRVLATDSFVWQHADFRGRETIELARAATGIDIELLEIDAMEIAPERVGKFDVVLFLGVFYHLFDPIKGLQNAASVANDVLIVETAIDLETLDRPAMVFYPGRELADDPTNWWGPNVAAMKALLASVGFTRIDVQTNGYRAVFHAWKNPSARRGDPSSAHFPGAPASWRRRQIREGWRLIRRGLGIRR